MLTYRSAPGDASWLDRAVLIALRLCLVGMVLFCLFRPVLILRAAVPQQNFLGILLDDSRSMRVADYDGKPRGEFVNATFAPGQPGHEGAVEPLRGPGLPVLPRPPIAWRPRATCRSTARRRKLGDALQRAKDEFTACRSPAW